MRCFENVRRDKGLCAKTTITKFVTPLSSLLLLASLVAALPVVACAQDVSSGAALETKPAAATVARKAGRQETLKQITTRLSETTSLRILVDSVVARQLIVAPDDAAVTAETLEEYLTRLTRRLPAGTAWHKVYLPATDENQRAFTGDAVAQFAQAQKALLGRSTPGTVEIQGKVLSLADAAPVIQTLGLKPVYVLVGVRQATPGGFLAGGNATELMTALTKQLGVSKMEDVAPGTYKVRLPGPSGAAQEATVEVSDVDGKRRIAIRMGSVE